MMENVLILKGVGGFYTVLRQGGEPSLRVDSVEELVAECVLSQPGKPAGARRSGRTK